MRSPTSLLSRKKPKRATRTQERRRGHLWTYGYAIDSVKGYNTICYMLGRYEVRLDVVGYREQRSTLGESFS